MAQKILTTLKVKFDDPEDGWVGLTVDSGTKATTICVSNTPNDLFADLTDALARLKSFGGDIKVVSYYGGTSYVLQFKEQERNVHFSISCNEPIGSRDNTTQLFEFTGKADEILMSFWRSLRDLQGRFSHVELTRRWHRPFAWDDIDQLTRQLHESDTTTTA